MFVWKNYTPEWCGYLTVTKFDDMLSCFELSMLYCILYCVTDRHLATTRFVLRPASSSKNCVLNV